MPKQVVMLEVIFQTITKNGGLCVKAEEGGKDIWLPASMVDIYPPNPAHGAVVTLTGPEKLLIEKGLL